MITHPPHARRTTSITPHLPYLPHSPPHRTSAPRPTTHASVGRIGQQSVEDTSQRPFGSPEAGTHGLGPWQGHPCLSAGLTTGLWGSGAWLITGYWSVSTYPWSGNGARHSLTIVPLVYSVGEGELLLAGNGRGPAGSPEQQYVRFVRYVRSDMCSKYVHRERRRMYTASTGTAAEYITSHRITSESQTQQQLTKAPKSE
ncbi:hypothetical protein O988_04664 [Pseudogymnoascus sp. VKM F-3808]|nr:hypothetical protein O988_04664 [Pseudogymnoascus sp. VKM F-3808]